jgi:hypothetical protein
LDEAIFPLPATGSGSINWTAMADPGDGPMENIFSPGVFGLSELQSHSPSSRFHAPG